MTICDILLFNCHSNLIISFSASTVLFMFFKVSLIFNNKYLEFESDSKTPIFSGFQMCDPDTNTVLQNTFIRNIKT